MRATRILWRGVQALAVLALLSPAALLFISLSRRVWFWVTDALYLQVDGGQLDIATLSAPQWHWSLVLHQGLPSNTFQLGWTYQKFSDGVHVIGLPLWAITLLALTLAGAVIRTWFGWKGRRRLRRATIMLLALFAVAGVTGFFLTGQWTVSAGDIAILRQQLAQLAQQTTAYGSSSRVPIPAPNATPSLLEQGRITLGMLQRPSDISLSVVKADTYSLSWWFHHETISAQHELSIPLWVFTVAATGAALLLWRRDARKFKPGTCVHCGYDLTGIDKQVCPECGANRPPKVTAPAAAPEPSPAARASEHP